MRMNMLMFDSELRYQTMMGDDDDDDDAYVWQQAALLNDGG